MASSYETETNAHNAPTIPSHNTIEWADAVIKWTREPFIDVIMYPSEDCDESLIQVFKGDLIQVSPRHRSENWCLCRSGHVMGWLNLKNVKFIVNTRQPAPPEPQQEVKTKKKALVSRLIGFFKKG